MKLRAWQLLAMVLAASVSPLTAQQPWADPSQDETLKPECDPVAPAKAIRREAA